MIDTPANNIDIARRALNLLDAGEVSRFHAVPTIPVQSVGQHTYGVLAILLAMDTFVRPEDLPLLTAAMLHDAPELYTGDVPFTTKRECPEVKAALDKAEFEYSCAHLFISPRLSPRQCTLLKLADMLEGLRWSILWERGGTVQGRWLKAIEDLVVAKFDLLEAGELNRYWALLSGVLRLARTGSGSSHYGTVDAFLRIHARDRYPTHTPAPPDAQERRQRARDDGPCYVEDPETLEPGHPQRKQP
jgi:hypothetical protein